jgi:hypothetical protein
MFMWWLLIPAAAAVVTAVLASSDDGDSSSSSSSSTSKLPEEKKKRENVRKKVMNDVLLQHRSKLKTHLESSAKKEYVKVGDVAVSVVDNVSYKIEFRDIDKTILELKRLVGIISDSSSVKDSSNIIRLKTDDSLVSEILRKADSDYGSLAGIDSNDYYAESNDPFLKSLRVAFK